MLKELRVELDRIVNSLNSEYFRKNKQTASSITNTELAIMWMGELMLVRGSFTPYKESMNSANTTVEPTQDTTTENFIDIFAGFYAEEKKNDQINYDVPARIRCVKHVRQHLQGVFDRHTMSDGSNAQIEGQGTVAQQEVNALMNIITTLKQARMWLGKELALLGKEQVTA